MHHPKPQHWSNEIMSQKGKKWACHDYPATLCPDDPVRLIAHGLRVGKHWAVMVSAQAMAGRIPSGSTLVPIPSSDGGCYANKMLAHAICQLVPGLRVIEALSGRKRQSQYHAKKAGVPLLAHQLAMHAGASLPEGSSVVLIDNVLDTGQTYLAACDALQLAPPILVWAMTPQTAPMPRPVSIGRCGRQKLTRPMCQPSAGRCAERTALCV